VEPNQTEIAEGDLRKGSLLLLDTKKATKIKPKERGEGKNKPNTLTKRRRKSHSIGH